MFPNVEGDVARPIEVSVRTPSPIDPSRQGSLSAAEIEVLHLDEVALACATLRIPGWRAMRSWSIDWGGGERPSLNGRSAQLAALLAYLAGVLGRKGARLRGWLRDTPTIWATGSLRLLADPADPQVEPWSAEGAPPDTTMQRKFEAFLRSDARVFFIPKSEIQHVRSRVGDLAVSILTVAEFGRAVRRTPPKDQRFVVVVDVSELRAIVDVVLDGVFPRGPGFWLANTFTAFRIPLGVLAALATFDRRFDQAAQLYVFGLLTDVADGITARLLHGTSEFGKKFDRQTDMVFNAAVGLGLVSGGLYSGNGLAEAIAILALTVGVMTVSRLLGVAPGSGIAKLRSGWIRAVLLAFIVPRMTWEPKLALIVPAALAVLTLVGVSLYEIDLVCRDVASGRRSWLKRK